MGIRIATKADIAVTAELNQLLYKEDAATRDPFADIEAACGDAVTYFETFIGGESTDVFLAEENGVVAGYLGARYSPGNLRRPVSTADLESIYVRESCRGRQIGALLIDAFFSWAKEKGAGRASVTAFYANESARRLYERHGFTSKSVTLDLAL
jgi:ribosomal protein S18 acetylase RimI-like enzyme